MEDGFVDQLFVGNYPLVMLRCSGVFQCFESVKTVQILAGNSCLGIFEGRTLSSDLYSRSLKH